MIPYDWQPSQIWYRIKCWFKRYTTVKPRTMGHTWQDRCELMPHMMFEILSQFVEKECSPGPIEWYGEYGHKITVDGKEKYVRDEIQEIYDWWHQEYLSAYPKLCEQIWSKARKIGPQDPMWLLFEKDVDGEWIEHRDQYREYMQELHELETNMNQKRQEMLHRMVDITPFLWT